MTAGVAVETVRVELANRSYDIIIGEGLLAHAGDYLAAVLTRPRVVIVTDKNVAGLHLATLRASLDRAGIATDAIIVPPGEGSKNFFRLEDLLDQLLTLRVERRDTIVALGGGVVGDLAGFAAAILRRGVDFIQMPTTRTHQQSRKVLTKCIVLTLSIGEADRVGHSIAEIYLPLKIVIPSGGVRVLKIGHKDTCP